MTGLWVIKIGDVMYDTRELKSLMKYFINNSLQLTLHCK